MTVIITLTCPIMAFEEGRVERLLSIPISMTWIAVMTLPVLPDLPRSESVKIVTNPGCAKFGVFLFFPLSCPICDGPVLFPVLSPPGPYGLLGLGLVLGLVSEPF